jgi:hypothetical protein
MKANCLLINDCLSTRLFAFLCYADADADADAFQPSAPITLIKNLEILLHLALQSIARLNLI